jgi:ferredoxin
MVTIVADLNVCQGYANCVVTAPDLFDLGEAGKVEVLVEQPADLSLARQAVEACPVGALRLDDR